MIAIVLVRNGKESRWVWMKGCGSSDEMLTPAWDINQKSNSWFSSLPYPIPVLTSVSLRRIGGIQATEDTIQNILNSKGIFHFTKQIEVGRLQKWLIPSPVSLAFLYLITLPFSRYSVCIPSWSQDHYGATSGFPFFLLPLSEGRNKALCLPYAYL